MKKCPFCAEEIQDGAVKCRHCQSDLTEYVASSPVSAEGVSRLRDFELWMSASHSDWVLTNRTNKLLSYQRVEPGGKGSCLVALILLIFFVLPRAFVPLLLASRDHYPSTYRILG